MKIEIVEKENTDHLPLIVAALNKRFHTIKAQNPRGYLDQFESQIDSLCIEVAGELGGVVEINGAYLFKFL